MNEKLNKIKQTVKSHKTEILALSVAAASIGVAVYVVRKNVRVPHNALYLRMSKSDAKMLISGNEHIRFDTPVGPFILKALIQSED